MQIEENFKHVDIIKDNKVLRNHQRQEETKEN